MTRNARFSVEDRWKLIVGLLVAVGLVAMGMLGAMDRTIQEEPNVTEEAYEVPAPEEGDEYFEAQASDGRWISYVNPRDEYRDPYLGGGSGKICVTLLNERGEVVAGESVPDTTVRIPTGEAIEWHSSADPMTVRFPLTDHYERPLDSDQFGTNPDLPQGDGYMDAHCIEFHGPAEDETIEYGEARIEGEYADRIDVVGYIQKHGTWESDIDPIAAAEPYEEAGGGWTYRPDNSHGQAIVVLQLDSSGAVDPVTESETEPETETETEADTETATATEAQTTEEPQTATETDDETATETETEPETETNDTANGGTETDQGTENRTAETTDRGEAATTEPATATDEDGIDGADGTDDRGGNPDVDPAEDETPGFGILVAGIAIATAILARKRR